MWKDTPGHYPLASNFQLEPPWLMAFSFEHVDFFYESSCQSRFSGVHLVLQVFHDIWYSNKESPGACWNATLSCPSMASNYANLYLALISFWMLTVPWAL